MKTMVNKPTPDECHCPFPSLLIHRPYRKKITHAMYCKGRELTPTNHEKPCLHIIGLTGGSVAYKSYYSSSFLK